MAQDGTFADLAKRQEAVGGPHDAEFFEVSFGEFLCGRGMNALSFAGGTECSEVFFRSLFTFPPSIGAGFPYDLL
jgi:hypothetical protein